MVDESANKPLVYEVPRLVVDFLEKNAQRDLTPRDKKSVLAAVALEDVVMNFGFQHFGRGIIDNIVVEPVKDFVVKNWGSEFIYDLSSHSLPLTFRATLAAALFYTRFAEHLSSMGEVEIYATPGIKELFKEHNITLLDGLNSVNFSELPAELKRSLVEPMLRQVHQAKAVALAYHLFPNGIDNITLGLVNPNAMFQSLFSGSYGDRINFSSIQNLEAQAQAAAVCIENYVKIRQLDQTVTQQRAEEKKEREVTQKGNLEERVAEAVRQPWVEQEIPKYEIYPKGTTLYKALEEHATKEELDRAWALLNQEGRFGGEVEEPHTGERMAISLNPDGTLRATYTLEDTSLPSLPHITLNVSEDALREVEMTHESSVTFDLLTTQVYGATGGYTSGGEVSQEKARAVVKYYRDRNLGFFLNKIDGMLAGNKEAIQKAQHQFGTTTFSIERGLWDALTAGYHRMRLNWELGGEAKEKVEADKQEADVEEKLAHQAAKLIGKLEWLTGGGEQVEAKDYSGVPVPSKALDVDYAILRGMRNSRDTSLNNAFDLFFGGDELPNRLAEFLGYWSSLLSDFKESLLSDSYCFNVLSIAPTSDQAVIRQSFRNIAMYTHPDRTQNLPAEEQLAAAQKFIDAKQAYEQLMKSGKNLNASSPVLYLGRVSQLFKQEGLEFLAQQENRNL